MRRRPSAGLRWNDPAIGIEWPIEPREMSDKDRNWPDLDPDIPRPRGDAGPDMKVLLTGASSFTGFWFARALNLAPASTLSRRCAPKLRATGMGPRAERVRRLAAAAEIVEAAPFGSDRFIDLARGGSYDALCHHAARVGDYRSRDFDIPGALQENTANLRAVSRGFRARGSRKRRADGQRIRAGRGRRAKRR